MGKITTVNCIGQKRHSWKLITSEFDSSRKTRDYKWCRNCGSTTEFYNGKRCIDVVGTTYKEYYIEIPRLLTKDVQIVLN